MCHALMLFASHPLPLVRLDSAVWLGVSPLPSSYDPHRAHAPAAFHAYYVSSHGGCSCGFHSSEEFLGDERSYEDESRRALAEYLREQLERQPEVSLLLFDTWEGDFSPPDGRVTLNVSAVAKAADPVPERTLAVIVADDAVAR
jgi:hypothetical protein